MSLLPPSIADYVHETNSVRAIDAYVETLDLAKQQVASMERSGIEEIGVL